MLTQRGRDIPATLLTLASARTSLASIFVAIVSSIASAAGERTHRSIASLGSAKRSRPNPIPIPLQVVLRSHKTLLYAVKRDGSVEQVLGADSPELEAV